MTSIPVVKILNIPMYAGPLNGAVVTVIERCCTKKNKQNLRVSATGAHGLVTSRKNAAFHSTLSSCFLNLPDGMPGVWIGRLKGMKKMERCYGPDFFESVIKQSADRPINHFFCGGKDGVADTLRDVCGSQMNNRHIVGTFSPPFRAMTDDECRVLSGKINDSGTDILWIGLSTPKQELFAARIAPYVNVHFIVTVGAAFDFFTGKVVQAPRFIQRSGLEWFFRLCIEPQRLWKRYIEIVPLFILYNLMDFIFAPHSNNRSADVL